MSPAMQEARPPPFEEDNAGDEKEEKEARRDHGANGGAACGEQMDALLEQVNVIRRYAEDRQVHAFSTSLDSITMPRCHRCSY